MTGLELGYWLIAILALSGAFALGLRKLKKQNQIQQQLKNIKSED